MTRRQRIIAALVVWAPTLSLLAISAVFLLKQIDHLLDNAETLIVGEVEHSLNREVRIRRALIRTLGTAVFEGVEVADDAAGEDGRLFFAKKIVVRYDWRGILLHGAGAGGVSEVIVEGPEGSLVRRADGSYNVEGLLRPPSRPPGPPFKGRVVVVGGSLRYKDYLAPVSAKPEVTKLSSVDLRLDAAKHPDYSFSLSCLGEPAKLGLIKTVGLYKADSHTLAADLDVSRFSVPFLVSHAGNLAGVEVLQGTARAVVGVNVDWATAPTRVTLTGAASFSEGAVKLPGVRRPLEGLAGDVAFEGNEIAADVTGTLAGSDFAISGTADILDTSALDFIVRSQRVDYNNLLAALDMPGQAADLRLSGVGPINARVTGTVAEPLVEVTARVPGASFGDYRASAIDISAAYAPGMVDIRRVRMSVLGADLRAAGSVSLGKAPRFALRGRVSGVSLDSLPIPDDMSASGAAAGAFQIAGPVDALKVRIDATATNGSVYGQSFRSLAAQLDVEGNRAHLESLVAAGVAGGVVSAAGDVSPHKVDLRVTGESVALAKLAPLLDVPAADVDGIGFISGRVLGPPSDPTIEGIVEVFGGRHRDLEFDFVRAAFSGDRRRAGVSDGVIRMFPADLTFSGEVNGIDTDRIAFEGDARLERASASKLLDLFHSEADVSGTLVADVKASGVYDKHAGPGEPHIRNAAGSAELRLEDGSAYGLLIDNAVASVRLDDKHVQVREVKVASESAEFILSGSVFTDTGRLGMGFYISDFDVSRLADVKARPGRFDPAVYLDQLEQYVVATGVVSLDGAITGQLNDPEVSATGNVRNLVVNHKSFDTAEFDLHYSDGLITSVEASLSRDDQDYSFTASGYDKSSGEFSWAVATVEQVRVPDLWDMVRASPYLASPEGKSLRNTAGRIPGLTSGRLNGVVQLSGKLTAPDGEAHLTATDIGVDIQKVESVVADASVNAGVVTIDQFRALSEEMVVEVSADPLLKEGMVNVDLNAQNLNLSRLRPWLGERTPGGVVSAEFNVEGDARTPRIIGSVEVVDPTFAGMSFDRLRASTMELNANRIDLSGIILSWAGHQVEARGYLPWTWSELTIPSDEQLELVATMREQDLSMLGRFTQIIDSEHTTGRVQGWMSMGGTLARQQLGGELIVADGKIALDGFVNTFTDVAARLYFDGDRVVVDEFTAASSQGGSARIVPGGYVKVGGEDVKTASLVVVADRLALEERSLFGFQERVALRLDAGLSITGPIVSPLVADLESTGATSGLKVSEARVAFRVPEDIPEREQIKPAINPSFDVSLTLGDDVLVAPPSMSLLLGGGGSISGSLEKPNVDLAFTTYSGAMNLAAARMRIEPDGVIVVRYEPAEVRVDIRANTSVLATSPLGKRERYRIFLDAVGPIANLQVNLSSSPAGLSRAQMLAALGHVEGLFTPGEAGLQQELGHVLSAVGAGALFAPIESLFVEKFGFEQFSLEYAPAQPLSLYFSRHLFGSLYLSFYRRLTGRLVSTRDVEYQVNLNYRWRGIWEFGIGIDDQDTTTFTVGLTRAFR